MTRADWNELAFQKPEDSLWYPRGDKHKLSALSTLWRDYYDCSIRSLDKLTRHGQMPSVMVMAYAGAVARLPCSVCAPPDNKHPLVWMYAELSPANSRFGLITHQERLTLDHNHLHIYNVRLEDAGLYRCQIGDSSSLAVLEVVDTEEKYSVRTRQVNVNYDAEQENNIVLDNYTIELFETFPAGIPCRSRFLPSSMTQASAIQQRQSEIMIALCKVACEAIIFRVRSPTGKILEEANNTAGIYSLHQVLPKQPPLPARDTIFADFGHQITIRCPGITLTDVPITWRFGTKPVVPRDVDKANRGRIYINSRDHLIITKILYRDANVYSCWQRDKLAGAVQVLVDGGRTISPRTLLLTLVALCGAILVAGSRAWRRLTGPYLLS